MFFLQDAGMNLFKNSDKLSVPQLQEKEHVFLPNYLHESYWVFCIGM